MRPIQLLAASVTVAGLWISAAMAEDYPSQPIRIVVPVAAGGGTDLQVRTMAPAMERHLGQPVTVLNMPGGGTIVGARQVYEAEPDGHTALIIITLDYAYALGRVDFSTNDMAPVARTVADSMAIYVRADSPIQNLDDLITEARARPGEVLASLNLGTSTHFSHLLFAEAAGVSFRYVQAAGSEPTITALLGGHVETGVFNASEGRELVANGQLRAVVSLGETRAPSLPDVPTARESGIDVVGANEWIWLMPKDTPPDRVAKFAEALGVALDDPMVRSVFDNLHLQIQFLSGDAFEEHLRQKQEQILEAAKIIDLE